jgi:hypothetical protein
MKKSFWLLFYLLILGVQVEAQEDIFGIERKLTSRKSESNVGNVARNFLSFLNFEVSSGGSYHFDKFIYNLENQLVTEDVLNSYITRFNFKNDSLLYDGYQYSIPIHLGVRLEMFSFFTLGGGISRETGNQNMMSRENETLVFSKVPYQMTNLYATGGLVLYDANRRKQFLNWRYRKYAKENFYMQSIKRQRINQRFPWRFILEGEVGKSYFNNPALVKSIDTEDEFELNSNFNANYYSLYLRTEYLFSEYSKLFLRAGASVRESSIIQLNNNHQYTFQQNLITVNLGLSIALPGSKRCRKPGCGVVMKHYHDGVEFRGSSIFNLQQRKIGQWY